MKPRRLLSEGKKAEILRLWKETTISETEIARQFGVQSKYPSGLASRMGVYREHAKREEAK